jgi:hypothetical protein
LLFVDTSHFVQFFGPVHVKHSAGHFLQTNVPSS